MAETEPKPKPPIDFSEPLDNERHELYCTGFLLEKTKIGAYYYAGYGRPNPSKSDRGNDRGDAAKMFRFPDIQGRLRWLRGCRLTVLDITEDSILREQARLAKFDIGQTFNDDGTVKPIHTWGEDLTRCIQSVRISHHGRGEDKEEITEVKFHSKGKALEALMKNKGLFDKDNTQKCALYLEIGRSEE